MQPFSLAPARHEKKKNTSNPLPRVNSTCQSHPVKTPRTESQTPIGMSPFRVRRYLFFDIILLIYTPMNASSSSSSTAPEHHARNLSNFTFFNLTAAKDFRNIRVEIRKKKKVRRGSASSPAPAVSENKYKYFMKINLIWHSACKSARNRQFVTWWLVVAATEEVRELRVLLKSGNTFRLSRGTNCRGVVVRCRECLGAPAKRDGVGESVAKCFAIVFQYLRIDVVHDIMW